MWRTAGAVLSIAAQLGVAAGAQIGSDALTNIENLEAQRHYSQAESTARTYIHEHPESSRGHFLLGRILFHEQKAIESLKELSSGSAYQPLGLEEQRIVALDYVLLKNLSEADKWMGRVVEQQPTDAEAIYLFGRIKFNENEFENARSLFERSLTLRPRHVETENNIGLCWKELGDKDKARAAFATAIDWQGAEPRDAQPFLNLGELTAGNRQAEQAQPLLERAVALAPNNPRIHEVLANIYLERQELDKAKGELLRAIELSPEVFALHYKLGHLYRRTGQAEQAQREFEICAKLNSAHSSANTPNPYNPAP